jgi:hypothetical protein
MKKGARHGDPGGDCARDPGAHRSPWRHPRSGGRGDCSSPFRAFGGRSGLGEPPQPRPFGQFPEESSLSSVQRTGSARGPPRQDVRQRPRRPDPRTCLLPRFHLRRWFLPPRSGPWIGRYHAHTGCHTNGRRRRGHRQLRRGTPVAPGTRRRGHRRQDRRTCRRGSGGGDRERREVHRRLRPSLRSHALPRSGRHRHPDAQRGAGGPLWKTARRLLKDPRGQALHDLERRAS